MMSTVGAFAVNKSENTEFFEKKDHLLTMAGDYSHHTFAAHSPAST